MLIILLKSKKTLEKNVENQTIKIIGENRVKIITKIDMGVGMEDMDHGKVGKENMDMVIMVGKTIMIKDNLVQVLGLVDS